MFGITKRWRIMYFDKTRKSLSTVKMVLLFLTFQSRRVLAVTSLSRTKSLPNSKLGLRILTE